MASSIIKAVIGSNSAKDAASAQAAAAADASAQQRAQLDLSTQNLNKQNEIARGDITSARDTSLGYLNPFLTNGTAANNQLSYNLGIGGSDQSGGTVGGQGSLSKPFTMADYQADPGYAFRLAEGQKALARTQGAAGKYYSGAALKGLTDYNQNSASQEYQNAYDRYNTNQNNLYNRLAGVSNSGQSAGTSMAGINQNAANALVGSGQNAANTIASLGAGATNVIGQNTVGAGDARAQGTLGSGQAWITGINDLGNTAAKAAGAAFGVPSGAATPNGNMLWNGGTQS